MGQWSVVMNEWMFWAGDSLCWHLLSSTPVYDDLQVGYKPYIPESEVREPEPKNLAVQSSMLRLVRESAGLKPFAGQWLFSSHAHSLLLPILLARPDCLQGVSQSTLPTAAVTLVSGRQPGGEASMSFKLWLPWKLTSLPFCSTFPRTNHMSGAVAPIMLKSTPIFRHNSLSFSRSQSLHPPAGTPSHPARASWVVQGWHN